MKYISCFLSALSVVLLCSATSHAGFLIQVDTDGADDGPFIPPTQFSFGGDTTTASTSSHSTAVGLAPGDSLFGGNGNLELDTYLYTYDLDIDGDNLPLAAGTPLNDDGDNASGIAAGGSYIYGVYATWPITDNISSGGATTFTLTDDLNNTLFTNPFDQNGGDGPNNGISTGNEWILLGTVKLNSNRTYTLSQVAFSNSFVSMRGEAVLFEVVAIPEPSTLLLSSLFGLGMLCRRKSS